MGQKTHPYAFRLGVVTDWKSRWYSDSDYKDLVNEDWRIRDYLQGELLRGAVSRIEIERLRDKIVVEIFTARPGVVIGRRGAEAERLRSDLERISGRNVKLNVTEIKDADTDAAILARGIADQLENRVAFRRAMKRAVQTAMKAGAEGVKVECKGRLGGSEMGRREWYREGRVPLHTLRADIDYGTATGHTTVGTVGVKVWVYKGEVVGSRRAADRKIQAEVEMASGAGRGRVATPKSRAEQAAGEDRIPRYIEAGGGKRREADETDARVGQRAETEDVEETIVDTAAVPETSVDDTPEETTPTDIAAEASAVEAEVTEEVEVAADVVETHEATDEVATEAADEDQEGDE